MLVGLPQDGTCVMINGCNSTVRYNATQRQFGNDWPPHGYTMTGLVRMQNFYSAMVEVDRKKIDGAIVELGVWRGGGMIMAAAVQKERQMEHIKYDTPFIQRHLYLFDAFGTIPAYGLADKFLSTSVERVQSGFQEFGLFNGDLTKRIHFVKGFFNETTPAWTHRKDPIAVLRVDGNFYDSYQDAMYAMFDNVPVGGIVIFDDVFSHPNVMQFWNDFKADQQLTEELVRIDDHSS